jgi:hypothetical protein
MVACRLQTTGSRKTRQQAARSCSRQLEAATSCSRQLISNISNISFISIGSISNISSIISILVACRLQVAGYRQQAARSCSKQLEAAAGR